MSFKKIPISSLQVSLASPVYKLLMDNLDMMIDNDRSNPLNFSYKRDTEAFEFEATYGFLRTREFLASTCLILNRRLTPGFAKNGRVHLVGIDWRLLDHFFSQFECIKTYCTFHPIVDRKRVDVVYYYYEFKALPDLGDDEWWIKRHQPNDEFRTYSESFYIKVTLIQAHIHCKVHTFSPPKKHSHNLHHHCTGLHYTLIASRQATFP